MDSMGIFFDGFPDHQPTSMTKTDSPTGVFPATATNVPELRAAAKIWAKKNKDMGAQEFEQVVTSLLVEPSDLKKCMGGILLGYMPKQRSQLNPAAYENWLEYTVGWAAIDAIFYGNFRAAEMLENFRNWEALIKRLSKSENINKRRASLVLLTKAVKQSGDKRLSKLAFLIIDRLKDEKSILITKAISWLLRNLVQWNRQDVEKYLSSNKSHLPKIAIRETLNKLRTGRKSGL
jgi:3-methyladenine DNA glycosylase AlkD